MSSSFFNCIDSFTEIKCTKMLHLDYIMCIKGTSLTHSISVGIVILCSTIFEPKYKIYIIHGVQNVQYVKFNNNFTICNTLKRIF